MAEAKRHNEQAAQEIVETNKRKVAEMLDKLRLKFSELDKLEGFRYYHEDAQLDIDVSEKLYP